MPCSRPSALQPRGQTPSRHPIVLTSLLLTALALAALPPSARAAGPRYFPETGHNVPEVFLNYWTARGGLAIFGLPLTEPYQEGPLLVQWFERGRFERHPENAGTPYEVLLGQLGRETRAPDPPTIPVGGSAARFFPETGHNLAIFRAYWERNNGLALFGLPLTEELRERSALDGKEYTVQYFERARLEYHPENRLPYDVLLGHFGRRIFRARAGREVDPPAAPLPGQAYFAETGHNLGAGFLAYWQAHGGLAQFGYPLSEVVEERLEDGRLYRVQYFERARFEYHPEHAPPHDILLGQFGRRILAEVDAGR